jgi:peptide deformylase
MGLLSVEVPFPLVVLLLCATASLVVGLMLAAERAAVPRPAAGPVRERRARPAPHPPPTPHGNRPGGGTLVDGQYTHRKVSTLSIQPIRIFGDPVLRTAAEEVDTYDKELRGLVKDLLDTMRDEGGAGLAAPQLGVSKRVFSFDVDDVIGHIVNPVLEFPDEEEQDGPEGCLSLPGLYFDTVRRQNVVAKGFNEYGDPLQIVGTGLMARCLQHETDHLDGIIFIDRLDSERRKAALTEIQSQDWYNEDVKVKVTPHDSKGVFFKR